MHALIAQQKVGVESGEVRAMLDALLLKASVVGP